MFPKFVMVDVEFDMSIYEAISSNVFEGKDSSRNDL